MNILQEVKNNRISIEMLEDWLRSEIERIGGYQAGKILGISPASLNQFKKRKKHLKHETILNYCEKIAKNISK